MPCSEWRCWWHLNRLSVDSFTRRRQNSTDTAAYATCHKWHSRAWWIRMCELWAYRTEEFCSKDHSQTLLVLKALCECERIFHQCETASFICGCMFCGLCAMGQKWPLRGYPWWNISLTHFSQQKGRLRFRGSKEEDCMNIIFWILKGGIPYWQPNEYFTSLALTLAYCVDFFPLIAASWTDLHSARTVDFHVLESWALSIQRWTTKCALYCNKNGSSCM